MRFIGIRVIHVDRSLDAIVESLWCVVFTWDLHLTANCKMEQRRKQIKSNARGNEMQLCQIYCGVDNVILLVWHIGNKCTSLGRFGHHDTSAISWLNHAYRTRRSLFRKPLLPPTGFAEFVCSVIQPRLGKLRGWLVGVGVGIWWGAIPFQIRCKLNAISCQAQHAAVGETFLIWWLTWWWR